MDEFVRCPVCDAETRRRRFPRHLAETHPGDRLRETFAYSAAWAAVLPALAVSLLAAQTGLLLVDRPSGSAVPDAVATAIGVRPESVPAALAVAVAPAVAVLVAMAVVGLARGPGQRVRRGWQPRRFEHLLVLTWPVPFVVPVVYALGAGRRFVSVRYRREKLAACGRVTVDDLANADAALDAHRDDAAARAFESAGRLVQGLRKDPHVRNPEVCAHLDALGRARGMAAAICEHRATDQPATDAPAKTAGTTGT
jgi:hypothetical protein